LISSASKVSVSGTVLTVKGRIKLLRSFDQIPTHQYQGYVLVIDGKAGDEFGHWRIAVGPKAHEEKKFRIGDRLTCFAVPVEEPEKEWAQFYRVSGLTIESRGSESENCPAYPDGGIAPSLETYRANGHRRLHKATCETSCFRCPWGLTMPTEIILDHWNPSKKKWRYETHCYGPRGCDRYKSGPPYKVPGRKSGMVYVDNDVERENEELGEADE